MKRVVSRYQGVGVRPSKLKDEQNVRALQEISRDPIAAVANWQGVSEASKLTP